MVVRIRFKHRSRQKSGTLNRQAALVLATLMTPVAVMAWALAGWRLAADLKWTGDFAIRNGLFSHWQVWIALGIVIQFASFLLHRYAQSGEDGDGAAFS